MVDLIDKIGACQMLFISKSTLARYVKNENIKSIKKNSKNGVVNYYNLDDIKALASKYNIDYISDDNTNNEIIEYKEQLKSKDILIMNYQNNINNILNEKLLLIDDKNKVDTKINQYKQKTSILYMLLVFSFILTISFLIIVYLGILNDYISINLNIIL